ncbi:MAG: lptG [Rickettsiales bacterium]|jgi:lipopolysaccharide export system permease protein|nr:lptG [Rickettsiales bacterium]
MRIPFTLSFYIGRHFLLKVGLAVGVIVALIILTDVVELIRRSSGKDVPFTVVIEMALLRLPRVIQEILPFGVLFGGILAFTRLTQTNELIIARASGVSAWQFLAPALISAFLLGILVMTIFNPLSAAVFSRFERLENRFLRGQENTLAVSSTGIWLRESNHDTGERLVIHALHVSHDSSELSDVMFLFSTKNHFTHRIDAERARLKAGAWHLEKAIYTAPDTTAERKETAELPTSIVQEQLQDSFASPETISFWELPGFIQTLQDTGFSALRHRLHWHAILVSPFLFCTMVIIAASVSLRPPRQGKAGLMMVMGIMIGFLIYYMKGLVSALGESGTIPVALAAWVPVIVSLVIGVAVMLHIEDG